MKKHLAFLLVFWCACAYALAQSPAGKTYVVNTGYACKKMADGGCGLTYYSCMQFDKDSVAVWDCMVAHCTPKAREQRYEKTPVAKKYQWTAGNGLVYINGLDTGAFLLTATTITGKIEKNGESRTFTLGPVPCAN